MCFYSLLLLACLYLTCALASPTNETVDDSNPDPYESATIIFNGGHKSWQSVSHCHDCPGPSNTWEAHDETWTVATFNQTSLQEERRSPQSATFNFNGSAVYVFCILSNHYVQDGHTVFHDDADYFFSLDGAPETSFQHLADGTKTYIPDTLVFSKSDLISSEHTLTIRNGRLGGGRSVMLLDYITYTIDPELFQHPSSTIQSTEATSSVVSSSSGSKGNSSNKHTVIIAVVPSIAGCILVFSILLLVYRYSRRKRRPDLPTVSTPSDKGWSKWSRPRFLSPPSPTHSFHPSLFVRATRRHQSTPRPPRRSRHQQRERPSVAVLDEVRSDLASAPTSRSAPHDSNFDATRTLGRRDPLMAVQEWRRQSERGDPNVTPVTPYIHPTEMSTVDLSTHYEDSSVSSRVPPPEPTVAPTPVKKLTIMNN